MIMIMIKIMIKIMMTNRRGHAQWAVRAGKCGGSTARFLDIDSAFKFCPVCAKRRLK